VATGDLNADGHIDLVTANGVDVSVLLGNGAGGFATATVCSAHVVDVHAAGRRS
jgi:hypothetical protein